MRYILLPWCLFFLIPAFAEDEITLYDRDGNSTAYIAADDNLTIYMWSGKPVAYLDVDPAGGFHVHGFNGRHLGWMVDGILRDHRGDAVCARRESMGPDQPGFYTELNDPEPFKGTREIKPMQELREFAPFRPSFSYSWSEFSCNFYLNQGVGGALEGGHIMDEMNWPEEMNPNQIPAME